MHEWHSNQSKNILSLIREFQEFEFCTDYGGKEKVSQIKITNNMFPSHEDALTFVTKKSYGSNTAFLAAYTTKKLLKGYLNAFTNFLTKYNEYLTFKMNLTISYGRTSSKVTCPDCKSSINIKYGNRFKVCPICGSKKIISDSNWKALETKKRLMQKAAENLSKEAEKNEVTFVCGIEWHC